MRHLLILALAAVACAANATVIYDNGAPDELNGNEMTNWRQSEDVTNNGVNTFNTIVFWTSALSSNIHDVDLQISFDDGAGNPGFVAVDVQGAVSSVATGLFDNGLAEYKNTFTFGDVTCTGSFVYHVAMLGNYEELAQQRDDVYWVTTGLNGTGTGRESFNDLQNNWFDNGQEHAFRLEEDAVTPEPCSMAALGLGAVALIRRRKASK